MKGNRNNLKLNVEGILAKEISENFSYYLERSIYKRSTFPGNNGDLKRIEQNDRIVEHRKHKGKDVASSIITEGFVQSCEEYLKCSKMDLFFGGKVKLVNLVQSLFYDACNIALVHDLDIIEKKNPQFELCPYERCDKRLQQSMLDLFSLSGEFCVNRENFCEKAFPMMFYYDYDSNGECHFSTYHFESIKIEKKRHKKQLMRISLRRNELFRFLWAFGKEELLRSFTEKIINFLVTVPMGSDKKPIKFHELNNRVSDWLNEDVATIIVPNIKSRLENSTLFSYGIEVKCLLRIRNSILKDYSAIKEDSTVRVDILEKGSNNSVDYKNRIIAEHQVPYSDLLYFLIEVRNRGYDTKVYNWKYDKNAMEFLGKSRVQDIDLQIIDCIMKQRMYLELVPEDSEMNII